MGQEGANKLVTRYLPGDFAPLMVTSLLIKYEGVLGREDLFTNSRLNRSEREELLDIFLAHCQWARI